MYCFLHQPLGNQVQLVISEYGAADGEPLPFIKKTFCTGTDWPAQDITFNIRHFYMSFLVKISFIYKRGSVSPSSFCRGRILRPRSLGEDLRQPDITAFMISGAFSGVEGICQPYRLYVSAFIRNMVARRGLSVLSANNMVAGSLNYWFLRSFSAVPTYFTNILPDDIGPAI